MRIDHRLLAAVIAPLLVWPWIPPWDSSTLEAGLTGVIVFCISIAVVEEVIFRGGVQTWLLLKSFFRRGFVGFTRANWLTSSFFAAAHVWQHPLALVPGYLAVSLMLGHFRERYDGILIPTALHAWYNLALLLLPRLLNG